MIYLKLFLSFAQVGLFTVGGGYAAMPLIQSLVVDQNGWLSMSEFADLVTIAEMTPGPIIINSATFVGFRVGGVLGSACATLGVVLPSFVIISLIAVLLRDFSDLKPVRYAFFGIRAGVLALLLNALWKMFKKCPKKAVAYAIVACAFVLSAIIDLNVLIIIAASAVVGLTASLICERRKDK